MKGFNDCIENLLNKALRTLANFQLSYELACFFLYQIMCCHITVCYKEEFLKFNIWNQFIQAAQEGVSFIKSELEFVCFSRFFFYYKI